MREFRGALQNLNLGARMCSCLWPLTHKVGAATVDTTGRLSYVHSPRLNSDANP